MAVSRPRLWLLAAWAAILSLAGSIYLGPYIAAWRIRRAVTAGDSQALAELVDFPAVREDLKGELRRQVGAERRARERANDSGPAEESGTPEPDIGGRLAVAVGEALIERYATPEAVGEALEARAGEGADWETFLGSGGSGSGEGRSISLTGDYDGWNDFRVRLTVTPEAAGETSLWADILFERRGIWAWQVAGARVSPDTLPLLRR